MKCKLYNAVSWVNKNLIRWNWSMVQCRLCMYCQPVDREVVAKTKKTVAQRPEGAQSSLLWKNGSWAQRHSSDLTSSLDDPWVELNQFQYQTPTTTNQGIACFDNPWPTFMSSRAKKEFGSTFPHNCAWKGFSYLQFEGSLSSFHAADRLSNIFTGI